MDKVKDEKDSKAVDFVPATKMTGKILADMATDIPTELFTALMDGRNPNVINSLKDKAYKYGDQAVAETQANRERENKYLSALPSKNPLNRIKSNVSKIKGLENSQGLKKGGRVASKPKGVGAAIRGFGKALSGKR